MKSIQRPMLSAGRSVQNIELAVQMHAFHGSVSSARCLGHSLPVNLLLCTMGHASTRMWERLFSFPLADYQFSTALVALRDSGVFCLKFATEESRYVHGGHTDHIVHRGTNSISKQTLYLISLLRSVSLLIVDQNDAAQC